MVGVAGKSKACNDCKRRRVKCDFERPGCQRCVKAGLQCSGYEQQVFFVNRSIANPSVSAPQVLARTKSKSIQEELDALVAHTQASATSPAHFRQRVFKFLQKLYLPRPEVESGSSDHCSPYTWFQAVCELQGPCPTLDYAFIAFITIQVVVTETGSVTREQAWERYHTTLGYLSSALNDEEGSLYVYILAAILVLSTCELFLYPTDDGLRVHVQGIADVLGLQRGCSRVSPMIRARLFSRLRVISTIQQLTCRQPGPVSAAHWDKLMAGDTAHDALDHLITLVAELPATISSASCLSPHTLASDREAVTTSLATILESMYTWQDDLRSSSPVPLYTAVPSRLANPADASYAAPLFPFALEFRSIQTATLYVCSWGFQLHISLILLHLAPTTSAPSLGAVETRFGAGGLGGEAERLARLLCQSIEYCHRIEMGTYGPQTMVYSQWVLRHYLRWRGAGRELEWAENVAGMRGEPTRCGIGLMKFTGEFL